MMSRSFTLVLCFGTTLGCAHDPSYVTVTHATAAMKGRIAADYAIPPDDPRGDLRIASFGITEISPGERPEVSLRALHLRMIVVNHGDTVWTFDTRDQRLDLRGKGPIAPSFASANPGSPPPVIAIGARGKRVADLFFLLPADLQRTEEVPEFDALWRVNANPDVVTDRTPFDRLLVEPDFLGGWEGDYGDGYYWRSPYWVDAGFGYGYLGFPIEYWDGNAFIRRGPHFSRMEGAHAVFRGAYAGAGGLTGPR